MKRKKFVFLAAALLALSGCAGTPKPLAQPQVRLPLQSDLRAAFEVGVVSASESSPPVGWATGIWSQDAKSMLTDILKASGFLAPQNARYDVNISLTTHHCPLAGFDMTCTATVHYQVITVADQKVVMDETIDSSHTAEIGEALSGVVRERLAVRGATWDNYSLFLDKLAVKPKL